MSYQQVGGAPGEWKGTAVPPASRRRFAKARRRRVLLTAGTVVALFLGMIGYGVYRHLGPDPSCGDVRTEVGREPAISADLSAQHYVNLDAEVGRLHQDLADDERKAFFPFDDQVGSAEIDAGAYEKDVYRILTPNKPHLRAVTPDTLAADQRKVFADLSGLRSHCGS